jgi:hypothetical protein
VHGRPCRRREIIKAKPVNNQPADAPIAPRLTPEDIKCAWATADTQDNLIRIARLGKPPLPQSHLRALQRALPAPTFPDILPFLLSAVLTTYKTSKRSESINHDLLHALKSEPQPYLSPSELHQYTTSYLHLLSVLPPSLLPLVPSSSRPNCKLHLKTKIASPQAPCSCVFMCLFRLSVLCVLPQTLHFASTFGISFFSA